MKLQEAHKFTGNHKGIRFLISHHGVGEDYRPEGTWCYYLFVHEDQLPKEYREDFILEPKFDDKNRLSHDYYDTKIADLDWHCGITYYSKEGGADGEKIVIKMGCDYGHYWDEDHHYEKEYLLQDVEKSIEKLFGLFPKLKIRSSWSGKYLNPDEGEFNEYGSFMSFKEKEEREAVRETCKDNETS